MKKSYPDIILKLIEYFSDLPGIGAKTSEKFVFFMLKQPESYLNGLAKTISNLKKEIKLCSSCFNFSDSNPCQICKDKNRNSGVICVVSRPQDVAVLEKTDYVGIYHVLGGTLNPLENITPDKLKIKELVNKVKNGSVSEIILALNPDIEGETTILYLKKILLPYKIRLTRLARGLPIGADLEYADEVTITDALHGRKEL